MDTIITNALIAGLVAGVVVLLIGLLAPAKYCPDCKKKLPKFRKPASTKQSAFGGWTCPHCGCEINRKGEKINTK
ncbi:MAG: hypothetical protein JW795_08835 [Chitinivibrionales bacterium]|nr:hypothetical protein [Chitinivibrionales bacterium]